MTGFSLIFLVNTALQLGSGQLSQQYGLATTEHCKNELFRAARIVQSDADGQLTDAQSLDIKRRINEDCYAGRLDIEGDAP
jgi:hypothetical protein